MVVPNHTQLEMLPHHRIAGGGEEARPERRPWPSRPAEAAASYRLNGRGRGKQEDGSLSLKEGGKREGGWCRRLDEAMSRPCCGRARCRAEKGRRERKSP